MTFPLIVYAGAFEGSGLVDDRKRESKGVSSEELVIEDPMKVSTMERCRADIERLREVVKIVRFK